MAPVSLECNRRGCMNFDQEVVNIEQRCENHAKESIPYLITPARGMPCGRTGQNDGVDVMKLSPVSNISEQAVRECET